MARYSLHLLKVPLNTKQTNRQFGARGIDGNVRFLMCPVRVGEDSVTPSTAVRDLGIYADRDASMKTQVLKTVSNSVFRGCTSNPQCPSLGHTASANVIADLTLRLHNYGNATLAGLPIYFSNRLQSVLNAAARLRFIRHGNTTV